MRKFLLSVVATVLLFGGASLAQTPARQETPDVDYSQLKPLVVTDQQKQAFQLAATILSRYQYLHIPLANVSSSVLDDYLNNLDYAHVYFLKSDIESFEPYRNTLLSDVQNGNLTAAMHIFNVYEERSSALLKWTLARLKQPFDLNSEATYTYPDYSDKNLHLPWRDNLSEVHAFQEQRLQDALIRLMIAGRTEEKALKTLTLRYQGALKQLNQLTVEDAFEMYMNAIAANYDPHSNYLSPNRTEDFDMDMSLSLDGIGATLGYKDEKIMVMELIPGGPAFKSGKLHLKDQIIGVGQGKSGEIQNVIGMRLDKVVRLIRGKKGTYVRLLVEPSSPSATEREVLIERDKINLQQQAAKAYTETVKRDGQEVKIGVIRLPSFYMDFAAAQKGAKDYRSTSRDVAKLLEELKAEKVAGIILDLRNNPGGSLYEAIHTVGLFIDKGPVVMVHNSEGETRVDKDTDAGALYSGPLAVMINHNSASAAEIFAGAIKDYHRGLIVGSNSYGKGTVQTIVNLNRFVPKGAPDLGELKFTIAMFHRITGSSTQIKGVAPDVELPSSTDIEQVGERANKHALPWKAIAPAEYTAYNDITPAVISTLQSEHQTRMQEDATLARYKEYVARVAQEAQLRSWSLNLAKRQTQYKLWKAYSDAYDEAQKAAIAPLNSDAERKKNIERRNKFAEAEGDIEHFVPDLGLYETLNIVYDYLQLEQANTAAEKKAA